MLNNKVSKAVRLAIAFGAVTTTAFSANTFANDDKEEKVERIQITGSKIKRIAATAPTPVVVIGRVELEDAGVSNVNDFLAEMPSAEVGLSPENSNNYIYANGLNTTDLRGLGTSRTLVLVNGRRFIGGSAGSNSVDLNNIATSMVERIEISTGGASAVYGADAVAGVVNIITRKSFDGIEIDAATTKPLEGGGEQTFASLVFGKEFDGGGFIFGYDYADQKQMARSDKSWWFDNPIRLEANPDDRTGEDGIPARIPYTGKRHFGLYDESSEFFLGGKHLTFDESGNLRPFNNGDGNLPKGGLPGSATNWGYSGEFGDGIAYGQDQFFRTPLERHTFNIAGHQDVSENHTLSFDLVYTTSSAFGQSTPVFWRSLPIRRDNAFIKADLAAEMDAAEVNSISMRRLSNDFGPRKYNQDRTTFRSSIGLDGYIDDNWSYSTYFQHGELDQDTTWYGEVIEDRIFEALDAVVFEGNIVCADRNDAGEVVGGISGCAPINFLGKNEISPEAMAYIGATPTAKQGGTQTSFGATVTGDVFELPAGFISTAFSFETRRETAFEKPGVGIEKGLVFGNSGLPYEGDLTVKEYAAEFIFPILADHAFAEELNVELAYRYMDYSSTGTDAAYKLGVTYQVNEDIRFRLAKAQSVRAPNISELYSSIGTQFAGRQDQCSAPTIASTDEKYRDNVIKNCAAAGIPAGWTPSDEWRRGGSLQGTLGGNIDLKNEVSNDITIGFVYTPSFLEGFDVTVDYWSFDIDNAISFYDYESSNENCYRADSLDNPFCDKFTRDPNTLEVNGYLETSLNAAIEKLSGVDIESVYGFETGFGEFDFKLTATYLDNRERNQTGNEIDNLIHTGEHSRPRWRARFNASYKLDDFRAVLVTNYRHATVNDRNGWSIEQHDVNNIPSYTTFDLSMNYSVSDEVELRLGVQNLADRTPPRHPLVFTDGAYYDVIGRRVTAGINIKL